MRDQRARRPARRRSLHAGEALRRFWLVVVLVAAMGLPAAGASAWEPTGGATFNNPAGSYEEKWRIVHTVDRAIRNARRNSTIMISGYLFDSASSADALLGAHSRGVRVQVVLDGGHGDTPQSRRLFRRFNRDNINRRTGKRFRDADGNVLKWGRDYSFVRFCKGSCRGKGSAGNHTKYYVFTRTGTAENVVMVGSSNLNAGGAYRGWNDLYIVKGKGRLVDRFKAVHAEMAEDSPGDSDRYIEFSTGKYTHRFFPRGTNRDPAYDDMAKVRCWGATGGAGRNGRTAINVSMFAWQDMRGIRLANRLVELAKNGCDVSVIYGAPGERVRNIIHASVRRGEMKAWNSRQDINWDEVMDFRTHHKYWLVNGVYGADKSSWRVHTGSQNWEGGTVTNADDNTLNIKSRAAYRRYLSNWYFIRDNWAIKIR